MATVYKKNFLTNVIFRVDFPKILKLNITNPPKEFQDLVKEDFPVLEEVDGGIVDLEIKENAEDVQLRRENKKSWRFLNKEKTKYIIIDSDFIALEYTKYTEFDEFFEDVKKYFKEFFNLYELKIIQRIGLRYSNNIVIPEGNPFEWGNFINKDLFSVTKNFITDKKTIVRDMQVVQIKDKDYNLDFRFGMFNSDYPNPVARKEFVLDFDCHNSEGTEIYDVFEKCQNFNKVITSWFEKSIEDGLRTEMLK